MPTITPRHYATALFHSAAGKTHKEIDAITQRFLAQLRKRKHTHLLPKIREAYMKVRRQIGSIAVAQVTSAHELTESQRADLTKALKKTADVETIELQEHIDSSVIGGVRVQIEDTVYDGTLRKKLALLERHLGARSLDH